MDRKVRSIHLCLITCAYETPHPACTPQPQSSVVPIAGRSDNGHIVPSRPTGGPIIRSAFRP